MGGQQLYAVAWSYAHIVTTAATAIVAVSFGMAAIEVAAGAVGVDPVAGAVPMIQGLRPLLL